MALRTHTRLTQLKKLLPSLVRTTSWWSQVEVGPPDVIFGLVEAFNKDTRSPKINLAIGAYRDDHGKPYVLPSVRKAEKKLFEKNLDKEYAGIMGYEAFRKAAVELALGKDSEPVKNKLYVTAQAVSGTGALRLAGMFLKHFYPYSKTVYTSNPTWGNHPQVFKHSGLDVQTYTYYNPADCGFNAAGCYADLKKLPDKSIILLHACAHNPTGVDPKLEQWAEISKICKDKQHFLLVDMAYQGFASGDLERDAAGLRHLVKDGHKVILCQSFSKNMGLYGERVGAVTVLCNNEQEVAAVDSQMKIIIRPLYSNPPINGARIAIELLTQSDLYKEWLGELKVMAGRIIRMRELLWQGLQREGSTRNWSHIKDQIGMFCYSGLSPQQVEKLKQDNAIYMTKDGRVSMVAITPDNVDYIAKAIHQVTK
ncbi:hypothetical protein EMCRGX_G030864 [Ephydatia muelleri]